MMTVGSPLHSPTVASVSVYNAKMVMASVMVETVVENHSQTHAMQPPRVLCFSMWPFSTCLQIVP